MAGTEEVWKLQAERLQAACDALQSRWDAAMKQAKEAAGHEFGLWPLGAVAALSTLKSRCAELEVALSGIVNEVNRRWDDYHHQHTEIGNSKSIAMESLSYWLGRNIKHDPSAVLPAHDREVAAKALEDAARRLKEITEESTEVEYTKDFNSGWDAAIEWLKDFANGEEKLKTADYDGPNTPGWEGGFAENH